MAFDFPLLRLISQEKIICCGPPVHDFTGDKTQLDRPSTG